MTRATRDGAGLSGRARRGLLGEDRETSRNPKLRQTTQSSANTNIFTAFDKGSSGTTVFLKYRHDDNDFSGKNMIFMLSNSCGAILTSFDVNEMCF